MIFWKIDLILLDKKKIFSVAGDNPFSLVLLIKYQRINFLMLCYVKSYLFKSFIYNTSLANSHVISNCFTSFTVAITKPSRPPKLDNYNY